MLREIVLGVIILTQSNREEDNPKMSTELHDQEQRTAKNVGETEFVGFIIQSI